MPRRIPDYSVQFTDFNQISSIGAFVFFAAQFIMVYNFVRCCLFRKGMVPATSQVWEGAHGLEWTLPSPPPYHTFEDPPHIEDHDEPGHDAKVAAH